LIDPIALISLINRMIYHDRSDDLPWSIGWSIDPIDLLWLIESSTMIDSMIYWSYQSIDHIDISGSIGWFIDPIDISWSIGWSIDPIDISWSIGWFIDPIDISWSVGRSIDPIDLSILLIYRSYWSIMIDWMIFQSYLYIIIDRIRE
jgi:hypothetical protein